MLTLNTLTSMQRNRSPFQRRRCERDYIPTAVHDEALTRLEYLVKQRHAAGWLTGPPGTGKSLLLSVLETRCRQKACQALRIPLNDGDEQELTAQLAEQLGIPPLRFRRRHRDDEPPRAVSRIWETIHERLHGLTLAQFQTVLLLDGISERMWSSRPLQSLLDWTRDELRQACTVVMVPAEGAVPSVKPSAGTTAFRIELTSLNEAQTARFIRDCLARHRCSDRQGYLTDFFEPETIRFVQEWSAGIPRRILRLCDACWTAARRWQLPSVNEDVAASLAS